MFGINLDNTRYMQYVSAIAATLAMAACSMYSAWPSPTLSSLQEEDSPIGTTITDEEGSWVVSAYFLGSIPGTLLTALVAEQIGRKYSLLVAAVPVFFSWYIIMFAKSAAVLGVARGIAGLGGGLIVTTSAMYNAEIAEKDIRGKLGTFLTILRLMGNLYVLTVGPFVSYTILALTCSFLPLIFVIVFYFMPESPYYLVKVGRVEEARAILLRLCSKNSDSSFIEKQLNEIQDTTEYDMQNKSTFWEFFSKPEYRKSLIAIMAIKSLQQLSGISAIEAYMQSIVEDSGSSISPEISSIIFGIVQLAAAFIAAALVDKLGRKPLLIVSALGCAVALFGEGAYFFLQDGLDENVDNIAWLPTTGIVLYLIMNSIGVGTLPYVLVGEFFATNIKGIAVAVATCYGGILAYLVTKFFEPLSNAWGKHTTFWTFGVFCILGSIYVFFFLPETKGKTFANIQAKLNKNHKNNMTESPLHI